MRQITYEGTIYDCEYAIEEYGYPSNGWDDAGAPTIVAITDIYVGAEKIAIVPTEIREKLEELIALEIDSEPPSDYEYENEYY